MIRKLLIANRGEIACRIAATARRMGIATVAVYSDADARARHVSACDEAWHIGPAPARESYLNAERILAVARESGAQAVHPGYGFLSENAGFARAVAAAGLVFVGPPADAIAAMGSKSAAKALMAKAGVPLVPGYHGDEQAGEFLRARADEIGYPVLIKASAGGGGRGMRIVGAAAEFDAALESCKRESRGAFGDDRVLLERYVQQPRHVEVQVFADAHGACVHLFERDCSVQRRHQKVIEEAPAPGMSVARRAAMGDAAVAAARAVGYVGAGTVEFIVAPDGEFFFMEMNTRLQVEHPVTEMVTGFDLVEWQLRVAAGEALPCPQEALAIDGHAIEARVYAENPERDFLPSIGRIAHLRTPAAAAFGGQGSPATLMGGRPVAPAGVRIDSGVLEGDDISPHYDPMIAKLIVWGADRAEAIARMERALAGFEVVGLATNIAFLRRLMANPAFVAGRPDTGLIGRDHAQLLPPATPPEARDIALAAAAVIAIENARPEALDATGAARGDAPGTPASGGTPAGAWVDPWSQRTGFRVGGPLRRRIVFGGGDTRRDAIHEYARGGARIEADGQVFEAGGIAWNPATRRLAGRLGERAFTIGCVPTATHVHLFDGAGSVAIAYEPLLAHAGDESADAGSLAAPMPGKVIALLVEAGAKVAKGQPLAVMEAMKMEHTIAAPADGRVREIFYGVGEQVDEGAQLIALDAGGA